MSRVLGRLAIVLVVGFRAPSGVRAQGDSGELWVTSQGTDRQFIVHGHGSSIETISVPGLGPHIITFSPLGDYAYVSGMRNGDLAIFRADDRQVVQVPAPGSDAHAPGQAVTGWVGAPRGSGSVDDSDQRLRQALATISRTP